MYRVLIVDDELPLLERMRTFDWAAQDCLCVGEASSAEEALRFCRLWTPHIVVTDINIPVMDGLTLLARLREAFPSMQVILLTVYQEFSYVQNALRNGAVDYLIKDMNLFERLPEALARAKAALERGAEGSSRVELLQQGGQLLLCAPGEALSTPEAGAFFSQFQGTLATARAQLSDHALGALLDDWATHEKGLGMLRFDGGFELLLRRPLRESQGRLLSLMHAGRIPNSLRFALGGPVTDEAAYRAQHEKNLRALENGFYEPLPPVFPTQETAFSVLPPAQSSAWLRDILALGLSSAPIQAYIQKQVAPFLLKMRTEPAQARALFEHLLQRQEAEYASRADADVYVRMRCAASLESLLNVYLERLEALAVTQSGYGYLVDEAIRCMEERLHESSLSLQEVSDYVHISPGYLSKKLKESTGLSFQELLIKMRMERAAALLRDGHMLVYEAAERLGYQNYRSFSAAFEKYYHCNPKKFKG